MFGKNRVVVLIPAYNEEQSVAKVIGDIPGEIADEIIVIDNASTDNTKQRALAAGAKVIEEPKRGYGAACLRGIANIKETDIVVILDADYSDYPGQIVRLLKPITDENYDFVLGSRIMGKREKGALAYQAKWGNTLSVFLIRLFFKHRFTDMGPFRAIRYESLKALKMQDKDFGWNAEMQIKAIKHKLRIKEVAVDYRRREGTSKISGTLKGTILAGYKILFTIFKYVFVKI